MKISRLNFRLVASSLLVLVFAQLAFTTIFIAPRAHAEGTSSSPADLAAAYNAGMALANCSRDAGWDTPLSSDEVNDGEFYADPTDFDIGGDKKTVGYLTNAENGQITCAHGEDIKPLIKLLGTTPAKFVIDVGIYKYNSGDAEYNFNNKDLGDGDTGDAKAASKIKAYVADKFKFSYSGNMSDPMQYAALLASFNKQCKGTEAPENTGLGVFLVGADGKKPEKKKWFTAKDGNGKNDVIEVGYGLDADGGGDQKMSCNTIVQQMNAKAQAYADLVTTNLNDGNPDNDTQDPNAPGSTTPEDACSAQGGVLSWVLCPVITLVGSTLNWVDTQLTRLLEIDRTKYNDNENLYKAWSQFRNLGLTLLIAAMLVMVISTALGIGAFDAYTVKKAFPRMVASVVFMLLSWYVCVFLIDISNVVGHGTLGLMTSPFGNKADSITNLFGASAGTSFVQIGGIAIGATAFSITGAPGILLSWIGTGLLIMAIAFIVLVARQMFVIVLILLSPLAILSWIFPGNDKIWKFWWQSFSKLLLMFPMVMALIASGRIFAAVIATTQDAGAEGGLLNPLLKLTAYILPYAFIPFTFKAAGGAFGSLAGMVNDRSRGAFDRLKKGRQKSYGEIGRNMKAGQGFRGDSNNIRNRLSSGVAAGPRGWVSASNRRASRETGMAIAGMSQLENNQGHKVNKGNDAYLLALADEKLAQEKIDKLSGQLATETDADKRMALNAEIATRTRAMELAKAVPNKTMATRRAAALELTQTGYQFSQGEEGLQELSRIAEAVSSDEGQRRDFMNTAQYNLKGAGRSDLGGINHGVPSGKDGIKGGIRKLGNYQRGQGKTDTYYGGATAWMGAGAVGADGKTVGKTERGADGRIVGSAELGNQILANVQSGQASLAELSEWHSMLLADQPSASDANKLEIQKQIEAIEHAASVYNRGETPGTEEELGERVQFIESIQNNRRQARPTMDPSEREKL